MKLNWFALAGFIAGGGLGVIAQALANALPHQATLIMNIVAIVVALAAAVVQFTQPAAKIVQDAPVVAPSGGTVGINVSTSSTVPINAPAPSKG